MSNKTTPSSNVSGLRITRRKLYVAMLAASQLMGVGEVMAAPEGGVVVGGAGTIDQSGIDTTIHQSSERMAIDWQSFDVKSNERVQFIQPKATSIALNRVVSNKGSEILGRIDANGQVFLINPNGVVFGKDSQINVGGMIASGLSIDPQDFMNGEFTLTSLEGTDGKVINSGIINASTGGSVTLIGQQVKNEGLISAKLGAVNLAAGKEAVVTFDKSGLVGVKVTKEVLQKDLGVDAAVLNSGEINAEGGRILITASVSQDIFSEAVNNGGMNKASSVVVHEDGSFTLGAGSDVVNTGNINASVDVGDAGQVVVLGNNITNSGNIHADATIGTAGNIELHSTDITSLEQNAKVTAKASVKGVGGDVKILGNKVGLFDAAEVNASGANGGGQVLIGGDQTGANIKIRNADFIYLGENTNVKTDGLLNGDGGKLITFASDTARIYGSLSAHGGSQGGNGGFIETSGLKGFEITNTPDVSAAVGRAGTWLIDPYDIEITNPKPNEKLLSNHKNVNITPDETGTAPKNTAYTSNDNSAELDVFILEAALERNATIVIHTADPAGNSDAQAGNITFSAPLSYDFTGQTDSNHFATLRLEASNDIIMKNSIVRANQNENKLNVELVAGGNVSFTAGAKIETQGGSFKASGINFTTADSTTPAISTNGGNVSLDVTGAVSIGSGINTGGGNFTATLSSSFDNSTVNGSINAGTGNVFIADSKFIKLGNITSKDLTINRTGADASFNILQNAATTLNISGDAEFDVHLGSDIVANGAGSILLNSANSFGNVSFISAGNVSIRDIGAINFGASTIFGTFNLTAGGDVSQSGALSIVGTTTLSAAGKNVALADANNDFQSAVSTSALSSVGLLLLVNKKNFSVGDINSSGSITLKVDPTFVQSSTKQISLNGNLTSSVGTVTFENQVKNTAATNTIDAKVITFNDNFLASGSVTFKNADDIKIKGDFTSSAGASLDIANTKNFSAHDIAKTKLTIKATGVVSINSIENSGITGDVSSNIQGTDGFGVDIGGDQISIGAINVTGGSGTPVPNSGFTQVPHDAGVVTIAGVTAVNLNGNITSEGGTGNQFAGVDTTTGQPISVATSGLSTVAQISVGKVGTAGVINLNYGQAFTSKINLIGNSANDTLNGSNTAREWSITAANSGSINNIIFSGIENLVGGNKADQFSITAAGSVASIDGGVGDANTLTSVAGGVWNITDNNSGNLTNVSSFANIQNLQGGTGNDTFDFSTTNNASAITGSIDGGAGINKLIGRNLDTTWNIDDLNKAHSTYASFTKIQTLQGGSAVDTFVIDKDFGGTLNGGGGNDIFNINVATTSILSGGIGNDIFNIKATANGDVSGDAGDDSFILFGAGSAKTIHGGSGVGESNTLTGSDSIATSWTINGANKGVVNGITFDGIQSLQGGSNQDEFDFFDGASIASANGGNGVGKNTADLSHLSTTTAYTLSLGTGGDFNVSNVSTFIGNDSDLLTLRASNADNTWVIDGLNSGTIGSISFAKFKNILGGTGADTFIFNDGGSLAKASGGLGAGVNTVDMSHISKNTLIVLDGAGLNGVTDISRVIGNKNFSFTLNAGDFDNTWTLDGVNKGAVTNSSLGATSVQFVDFNNLVGGAGVDTFVFKDGASIVSATGGTGINRVDLSNITTDTTITLNGVAINGVTKVSQVVGNGNKVFTLNAGNGANTWTINGANDGSVQNAAIGIIDFVDFKNLVGGSGDDNFSVGINGAINSISGGAGNNSLAGRNEDSTWNITQAQNSITGYVNSFNNIQNLQGGSAADTFNISVAFTGAINAGNGANTFNINAVTNTLIGGDDSDTFILGLNGKAVLLDGGAGAGINTLFGRNEDTTWNITGANDGDLLDANNIKYVSFKRMQTLQGGSSDDIFNAEVKFNGTFNAGGGANTLVINDVLENVTGGGGSDKFKFGVNGKVTGTLDGGGGDDTLTGRDSNGIWTINSSNKASLADANGVYVANFIGIETLNGGAAADTFNINAAFTGTIDAGAGANTFNINAAVGKLTGGIGDDNFVLSDNGSITSLVDGGGGVNILTARNAVNTWNITGANSGDVTNVNSFVNIQNLQGGSAVDTFFINQAFAGNIKGGAGADIFKINAASTGVISGESDDDRFEFGVAGSAVAIDGGSATEKNILAGRDAVNTWNITAENTGNVQGENAAQYTSFTNIQALEGNSKVDTFNINATFAGAINAGGGDDIFNVNAAAGKLLGEAGNDKFVFSSNANAGSAVEIDGGAGTNTLVGREVVASTWTIPLVGSSTLGLTSGGLYVTTFSNIQALSGGSGDDIFNIEIDFSGSIDAGGGLNTFVINRAAGNLKGGDNDDIFIFGINGTATSLDGGLGVNTLVGRNKNNTWNILADNSGTLGESTGSLYVNTFSNIQKLQGGSADDTFIINHSFLGDIKGGVGNDRFTINEDVGSIFGDDGNDTFIFSGTSTANLIDGGLGANNKVVGRNAANTWTLKALNDGAIQDTNTKTLYASFTSIQAIQGGSATDTLIGANTNTTWTVVAKNTGSLVDDKAMTVQFSNMENLIGNEAADNFLFSSIDSAISGLIDGGTSAALSGVKDTLDVKALTNGITIELGGANNTNLHVKNMESIFASVDATKNFLNGSGESASYSWAIDGINNGSVAATNSTTIETKTTFENFGHVLGGNKIDQFQVGVNGDIADLDGGDGDDYLDYSNKTIVNINLGSNGSIGSTTIKSIEGIKGNNDGQLNTAFNSVIAADGGNTWTITGINDGQITLAGKTISFENFNIINGGTGDDKFELNAGGQLIGTIHGGGGIDTFNASSSTLKQVVAIEGSAAGQTNLIDIKNVVGNFLPENLLIGANQSNDWMIGANGAGILNKSGIASDKITFSGFSRVLGGSQADIFTINNIDGLKIIIDGGSVAGVNDEVNLTALTNDVSIGVGEQAKSDIKIINISRLDANSTMNNTLVADEISSNLWDITGKNKGTLNSQLSFNGFANLLGGKNTDTFNFNGTLASITGVIDGAAGADNINLTASGRDLSVHVVNADKIVSASDINLINVESIDASADHINSLIASDVQNQWSINAKNSGSLTNTDSTIQFTNFTNLIGGSDADTFKFDTAGSLTGYIDGGVGDLSKDTVNVSKLAQANIVLGSDGVGYRNIGNYIGNDVDSVLTGDKNDNTWTLGSAKNSGDINNKIFFAGFSTLVGGVGNDVFNALQGALSGSIQGGSGNDTFNIGAGLVSGDLNGEAGNDILNITVATDSAQHTRFIGGADANSINVSGGDINYTAAHISTGEKAGQLTYTNQNNTIFNIIYSDVAAIHDDLIATSLTLNNTFNPDMFVFSNNAYSLNNSLIINYTNKANLIVAGAADDKISIEGEINGLQSLTIKNASVLSTTAGLIRVKDLNLTNVGTVGDATNRLNLSVDNISVSAANGDIYLKDDSGLAINEFANNKLFNLLLTGDLTSNKLLTSFGDFVADVSGKINLIQDNALSGNLTLSAGSDINFHNVGATNLNDVKAQNIDINSTGAINGNGAFTVSGRAVFASGDSLVLMNAANNFNELVINSAVDSSVTDKDLLTLFGVKTSGAVDVHSSGVSVKGVVDVADLTLDAGQKAALIDANISASQSINLNALGLTTTGKLSASEITLNGLTGDVSLGGVLDTSGKQTIAVVANNIIQNAKITGGGNVDLHANGSLTQNADIESAENILVAADGDLTMNANTASKGNDVNYTAGGVMNLLGNIVANNSIAIDGKKAVNQFGSFVSAIGNVVVKAGKFIMNGEATATANKGSVLVTSEDDIAIGGNINANSGVNITSTNGNFQQHAQINNQQNDIMVLAKNNIIMDGNAVSTATSGNINYAGNNIFLNLLNAKNGTVLLTANPGEVIDNNGSAMNIMAKGLDVDAGVGIGANDSIETSISELSASNSLGNIGITNNQAVNITQLRTNGNVTFENLTGNVVLGNQPPVSGGETPNRPATETPYQTNNLIIKVSSGNLLASGSKSVDHPEITATNTALIVSGTIGLVNRPLVIDGSTVTVNSRRTWKPIFASPGTAYTDIAGSSASASDITATSHEQLVQVETLAEVNPAIFTSVRNYVYDDIAILLPEDQRYDDSGE